MRKEVTDWDLGMKIKVLLTNRSAQLVKPYPESQLREIFGFVKPGSYFNPLYQKRDSEGKRLYSGLYSFLKYDRVPSGLFLAIKDSIEKDYEVKFKIDYARKKPKFKKLKTIGRSDRRYQNKCILAMKKASRVGGIILCATGTGKTYIAGKYFKSLIGTGVFIVDELGLLQQAQEELSLHLGEKVGYIGNMQYKPQRITVATAQTLHRHRQDPKFKKWHKSLDVVIIDELHEMLGKRNHEIVSNIKPKACFGLTATLQLNKKPVRMKAHALSGPVIYKFPLEEGVKKKYLSPGVVIGVTVTKAGHKNLKYWEDYDSVVACNKEFNIMVCKLIRRAHTNGKYILQLVKRPKHVRILSRRLQDIPHGTAHGEVRVRDRLKAKRKFENKKLRLLVANQVFKKGTNIKRVDLILDAANMPSANDAQQKYGRGVRLCDNKRGLIYIDIGFKNPEGVTKNSFNYNRFVPATRKRRNALRKLNIPVYEMDWNGSAREVLEFAERKLTKLLSQGT